MFLFLLYWFCCPSHFFSKNRGNRRFFLQPKTCVWPKMTFRSVQIFDSTRFSDYLCGLQFTGTRLFLPPDDSSYSSPFSPLHLEWHSKTFFLWFVLLQWRIWKGYFIIHILSSFFIYVILISQNPFVGFRKYFIDFVKFFFWIW